MTQRSALAPLTAVPLSGWADPAVLFSTRESQEPHAFFLDAGPDASTGWSYLGVAEPSSADQALEVDLTGRVETAWPAGPFRGGWIVALDYDGAAGRAGAPAEISTQPRALAATRFLAFDHAARSIWAVSPQESAESFAHGSQARIDVASGSAVVVPVLPEGSAQALSRHTATEYADAIAQCREAIREGDAYQLCMTTRFTVPGRHDAAAVFLRLRAAAASHHGAFLRFGDVAIVSASPEQFLTVSAGRVQTKPIKGTRPRGTTPEHDAQLAAELVASEKERAENVMIVDLMRNDLSRTCVVGSVRVDKLWHVESYPAVHQLVSTVSGELKPGTTLRELVDTTFPAGSMTGAPKLSAMTILHGRERGSRGFYAGCFGWVSHDGAVDLAMTIRTIVVTDDEAHVGAGGGITWLSNVQEEVQEVAIKAKAPLAALGARVQAAWLQPR